MCGWFPKTVFLPALIAGLVGNARAETPSWFGESLQGSTDYRAEGLQTGGETDFRGPAVAISQEPDPLSTSISVFGEGGVPTKNQRGNETGVAANPQRGDIDDLAAKFTNPVELLTSYQFNTWYQPSFWDGQGSGTEFMIRPVISIPKSNLIPIDQIMRVGFPIEAKPMSDDGQPASSGFADVQLFDLFVFQFTPDLKLAAGPIAIFPSATSPTTGQGRWQLGPALAGIYTGIPKWQIGLLLQNPYSIGSSSNASVSQLYYDIFLTRHYSDGWYVSYFGATGVADLQSGQWMVPVSVCVGRVFNVGKQPVNFSVLPAYYANGQSMTPKLEVEFNFALIYR
jgi:hypothetical protein